MTPLIHFWLPCFTVRRPDAFLLDALFEGRPVNGSTVNFDHMFELGSLAI